MKAQQIPAPRHRPVAQRESWRCCVIGDYLVVGLLAFLALSFVGCTSFISRYTGAEYDLGRTGDLDRLAARLTDVRLVFVGETHTRMDHHRLQLGVVEALHRAGRDLAIGMEWFQHPYQPVLDEFLAGGIDEPEMLDRTGYFERWRYDYRLYRPIIRFAYENNIPLLALNAPRELTKAVSRHGVDAVPGDLRPLLPTSYDRSNTAYEATLKTVFAAHDNVGEDRFARFVDVQLTWDESMAEQAADYLAAHPGKTLVVFAGAGHIAYGSGIPDRVQRRLAVPAVTILPADIGTHQPGSADILVATAAEEVPAAGLLGVFLEDEGDGLRISAFSEDSSAREAGLDVGDRLLAVEGIPVPHLAALKLALIDRAPGERVAVAFARAADGQARGETTVRLR
jgi:uncharacterized iron-regulated protein